MEATETAIFNNLIANGYINANENLLPPAFALTDISQFIYGADPAYKQRTYDAIVQTAAMETQLRRTAYIDYNYVAGAGYQPKRSSACPLIRVAKDPAWVSGTPGVLVPFNFCEPHGINGGDPKLQNVNNILGPDGLPFTLDDGLKPLPTSPLCGKGEGGTDIGAYSCNPNTVFVGSVNAPSDTAPPSSPVGINVQ